MSEPLSPELLARYVKVPADAVVRPSVPFEGVPAPKPVRPYEEYISPIEARILRQARTLEKLCTEIAMLRRQICEKAAECAHLRIAMEELQKRARP